MNNEIQSLEFEGNKARTAQDENGNPLFCGTDVAQVLGYANPAKAVINHCKGFPIRKPLETAGGIQQVRFISEGDLYMPTRKSMDLGLFEIKETTVTHADGHTTINKTPKVTGKGQTYFTNLFLKPTLEAGA